MSAHVCTWREWTSCFVRVQSSDIEKIGMYLFYILYACGDYCDDDKSDSHNNNSISSVNHRCRGWWRDFHVLYFLCRTLHFLLLTICITATVSIFIIKCAHARCILTFTFVFFLVSIVCYFINVSAQVIKVSERKRFNSSALVLIGKAWIGTYEERGMSSQYFFHSVFFPLRIFFLFLYHSLVHIALLSLFSPSLAVKCDTMYYYHKQS